MRGYVLTGDPAVLEQYEGGRRDLPARLVDLAASDVKGVYGQEQAQIRAAAAA